MDFDIHGIVGIRLINPSKSDLEVLCGYLGQFKETLDREPDLIFHFKDKLELPSFTCLGLDSAVYTDEGFYAMSSKENVKIRIPFDTIGERSEFEVESGFYDIPWLFDIINLAFLKKNYIPMHATAFVYNNVGFLVSGWAKGGKTETLLAFANHGAYYVGDEWVIISGDGKKMYGIPVPICIWEWQFNNIPDLLPKIGLQRKLLYKNIHLLEFVYKTFKKIGLEKSFPSMILSKALPSFKRQLKIRVSPEKIFNGSQLESAKIEKVILSFSHSDAKYQIEEANPSEIAKRIFISNSFEQIPFLNLYKTYKFAFPGRQNDFLENIDEFQFSLLNNALKNKQTFKVRHPYPFIFEDLFNHIKPLSD